MNSDETVGSEEVGEGAATVLDTIRGTHDALSVRMVFGDAYELEGMSIIPVAKVSGGAGGGGGEGSSDEDRGSGFGSGFGINARPVGVYEVHGGSAVWKPSVDVNRLARGGQVLAGLFIVCVTIIRLAGRR